LNVGELLRRTSRRRRKEFFAAAIVDFCCLNGLVLLALRDIIILLADGKRLNFLTNHIYNKIFYFSYIAKNLEDRSTLVVIPKKIFVKFVNKYLEVFGVLFDGLFGVCAQEIEYCFLFLENWQVFSIPEHLHYPPLGFQHDHFMRIDWVHVQM